MAATATVPKPTIQGGPRPVDQAAERVAAELVGPQPVVCRWVICRDWDMSFW